MNKWRGVVLASVGVDKFNLCVLFRRTEFNYEVAGSSTAIPLKAMAFSRPVTVMMVILHMSVILCERIHSCMQLYVFAHSVSLSG